MTLNSDVDNHFVCYDCCVSPLLKQLVTCHSVRYKCSLCTTPDVICINTANDDFLLGIKALIRYSFSEWQYHSKLSDGDLEGLFFIDPNPFLRINPAQSDVDRESVILSFLEDINERQTQIEIFTAYGRDIYNYMPKISLRRGESDTLISASLALRAQNHFLVEAEYINVLRPVVPYISNTVRESTRWHRARLGAEMRAANLTEIGAPAKNFFQPHSDKALGAPPVGSTGAGRANRPGVSYLYVASDAETAAAEIRPHPGELVSLGCFDVNREQRVADLRAHDLTKLWRSDQELKMLELIIAMEDAFATAAPPSNRGAYTITQFLVEVFRQLGFDGVLFRSTVGDGDNLVLFNPSVVNWVPGSSRVIDVKKVRYDFIEASLFDESTHYDIDYRDRRKFFE